MLNKEGSMKRVIVECAVVNNFSIWDKRWIEEDRGELGIRKRGNKVGEKEIV